MKIYKITKIYIMIACFCFFGFTKSYAQLAFELTPNVETGETGATLYFSATLKNNGLNTVYINTDDFDVSDPLLTVDDIKFGLNVPTSLNSGDSWSGQIFDVIIDSSTTIGNYSGSFTIIGGDDQFTYNNLAVQNFNVIVTSASPVPEPTAIAFLVCMIAAALLFIIRHLRKSQRT